MKKGLESYDSLVTQNEMGDLGFLMCKDALLGFHFIFQEPKFMLDG